MNSTTIYFAIDNLTFGMHELTLNTQFIWELSEKTIYNCMIAHTAGQLLDLVKPKAKESFIICKAIVSDEDVATAFSLAISPSSFITYFEVKVIETIFIDIKTN